MNKLNIIPYLAILFGLMFTSCVEDDNPGIEEHPWYNYDLSPIKLNHPVPVGVCLYNPNGMWGNAARMERLQEPYDVKTGKYGPYIKISAGTYRMFGTNRSNHEEYAKNIGNIVDNMKKAKVDFIITPPIRMDNNKMYPNNINAEDTVFLNMLSGHTDTLKWKNDGSMKFAIRFKIEDIVNHLGCNNNKKQIEAVPDKEYNVSGEKIKVPARMVLLNYIRRLSKFFAEPTYYRINGRPLLIFEKAHKLYTQDTKKMYEDIRATIKDETGDDVYILIRQERWTPPARWTYFWIEGHADAVTCENLCDLGGGGYWDRYDMWDIFMCEHLRVNREYYDKLGIDYVPSVGASYNKYVNNADRHAGIFNPDADQFRLRCNIAKRQLGHQPMVIIDGYNDWENGNGFEPTDEDYGNGYGDTFLNIIAEEFGH